MKSGHAKLARARIAAACGGVQTVEFRQWKQWVQQATDAYQSGERSPQVKSRQSARHRAWGDAEVKFRKQYPDRVEDFVGFTHRNAKRTTTLADDVRWAYHHAMIHSTTEADAPNAGSWLWLLEARENRSQFLSKVFALEQASHGGRLPRADEGKESGPDPGDHEDEFNFDDLLGPNLP